MNKIFHYIFAYVLRHLPLQRKVLFYNFDGRGYGDSPKYIAEYLHKHYPKIKLVWYVNDLENYVPEYVEKVSSSRKYTYARATAKIIVTNTKNAVTEKKRGQFLIQTWHAIFGPKYAEKKVIDQLSDQYVADSKKNSAITDLWLAACNSQAEDFRNDFWCESEIMNSGLPRDDIYFTSTTEKKNHVRKVLNIPDGKKVLIFAPTFRDSGATDCYDVDLDTAISLLERRTGKEWVALVRLHPNVPEEVANKLYNYCDRIINTTSYPDPQELLLVSDFLITDYSSTMFDFIIQKKPVILYTPDLKDNIRPLRPQFYRMPFPRCKDNAELMSALENFDEEEYKENLKAFEREFVSYDDGHASERVAERMIKVLG